VKSNNLKILSIFLFLALPFFRRSPATSASKVRCFSLQTLDVNSRLALLQILEERYDKKSMIIISQLPVSKWYDYIAESTLADAIMDRLVSNAPSGVKRL